MIFNNKRLCIIVIVMFISMVHASNEKYKILQDKLDKLDNDTKQNSTIKNTTNTKRDYFGMAKNLFGKVTNKATEGIKNIRNKVPNDMKDESATKTPTTGSKEEEATNINETNPDKKKTNYGTAKKLFGDNVVPAYHKVTNKATEGMKNIRDKVNKMKADYQDQNEFYNDRTGKDLSQLKYYGKKVLGEIGAGVKTGVKRVPGAIEKKLYPKHKVPELDFTETKPTKEGIEAIFNAVKIIIPQKLVLDGINQNNAQTLANQLRGNNTLEELDLSKNAELDGKNIATIIGGLGVGPYQFPNVTLTQLKLPSVNSIKVDDLKKIITSANYNSLWKTSKANWKIKMRLKPEVVKTNINIPSKIELKMFNAAIESLRLPQFQKINATDAYLTWEFQIALTTFKIKVFFDSKSGPITKILIGSKDIGVFKNFVELVNITFETL